MALHKLFRKVPRLPCEQLIRSVPMTVVTILQTPQLFLEILPPVISLVGADETSSRSNSTGDCCSNGFDNPYPTY